MLSFCSSYITFFYLSRIYLSVFSVDASPNSVNLFVHFGTMMVTLLTGTSHSEGHTRRMPSPDTGNFT
jgi:hypothetical protein